MLNRLWFGRSRSMTNAITTENVIARVHVAMPLREVGESAVSGFEPIAVRTNESGVADWRTDESSENRFIFEVKKVDWYQPAMIKALKATLLCLE